MIILNLKLIEKRSIFMAIYGIGDLHFCSENIIRFENRPFQSVQEMDETLIQEPTT